jgi:tripartite-type tricarboxylate transporter receptor subunit TctC
MSIGHWGTHALNGATYALSYDVLKDFEPVSLLANTPQWIIAKKALPPTNLKELVAWLKANPDKASAGTVGAAGGAQISGIYFQMKPDFQDCTFTRCASKRRDREVVADHQGG